MVDSGSVSTCGRLVIDGGVFTSGNNKTNVAILTLFRLMEYSLKTVTGH